MKIEMGDDISINGATARVSSDYNKFGFLITYEGDPAARWFVPSGETIDIIRKCPPPPEWVRKERGKLAYMTFR